MKARPITAAVIAAVLTATMPVTPSAAGKSKASTSTRCLPGVLKSTLREVERRFGKIEIVSTYRPHARIAGTRHASKHATCGAVDFKVKGNQSAALKWLRKRPLEVIAYRCSMHHLHIAPGNYKGTHCVNKAGVRIRR